MPSQWTNIAELFFTFKDINNALNFVWFCGVQTKVKPSAENLVDMDEKSILGLIWAVS